MLVDGFVAAVEVGGDAEIVAVAVALAFWEVALAARWVVGFGWMDGESAVDYLR